MHPTAGLRGGRGRGRGGGAAAGGRGLGEIGVPARANGGARSLYAQGSVRVTPLVRGNSMPRGGMNGFGIATGNNPRPPILPNQQQQQQPPPLPQNANPPPPVDNGRGRGLGRGRGRGRGNNMAAAVEPAPAIPGNSRGSGIPVRGTAAGNRGRGRGRGAVVRLPRNFAQPVQVPVARQPSFSGAGVASRSPSPIPQVGPVAVGLRVRGAGDPGTSTSIETSPSPSPPPVANRNARNFPGNSNDGNETVPLDDDDDDQTPPITPRIVAARPTAGTPMGTRSRRAGIGGKTNGTGTGKTRPTRIPPAKAPKRRSEERNVFHVPSPSIPRATFRRLVREFGDEYKTDLIWQKEALDALQEATEDYITKLFGMTAAIADNSGRSTIMEKDFSLATNIQTFLGVNLDRRSTRDVRERGL